MLVLLFTILHVSFFGVIASCSAEDLKVEDVFDVRAPLVPGTPDDHSYFIKKKYYTEQNLSEGRKFFEENCATCHGREADGTGLRAETMRDAKPRMLINLNWLKTRDDLRLLRSIKYGVPGTAMTPWGDFTSSLQRLQLVMFIRSLSAEHLKRDTLLNTLYKTFEMGWATIEEARGYQYATLDQLTKQIDDLKKRKEKLQNEFATNQNAEKEALKAYEEELSLRKKLEEQQKIDDIFVKIENLLIKEEDIYLNLGLNIFLRLPTEKDMNNYLSLILQQENRYEIKDKNLVFDDKANKENIDSLKSEIIKSIEEQISKLKEKTIVISGKISSQERDAELGKITADEKALENLKNNFVNELKKAGQLKEEQKKLVDDLGKKEETTEDKNKEKGS